MSAAVRWESISKSFGAQTVLSGITLEAEAGRLLCLLGPSGCGKTTLLRILAGFVEPDSGRVLLDGQEITHRPPHLRRTAMVFQNYALWPHLSVFDNVAYGLVEQGIPRAERRTRVGEILETVRLTGLAERLPGQLSGGQQQRVALARALVVRPAVVLLDEPLSNLDLVLRVELRQVIKELQERTRLTMIYVTHDRVEALELGHHIAVLERGRVEQSGTPRELYRQPRTPFVAAFLGETNLLSGVVESLEGDQALLRTGSGMLRAKGIAPDRRARLAIGTSLQLAIRPEVFALLGDPQAADPQANLLEVEVVRMLDRGEAALLFARGTLRAVGSPPQPEAQVGPAEWRILLLNPPELGPGSVCRFAFHPQDVVLMP